MCLGAMVNWLEEHPDFGAIALSKHGSPDATQPNGVLEPPHVDAGPVMFRREVFQNLTYQNRGSCECSAMTEDVRAQGYRIGFLTSWHVQHQANTRLS